MNEKTINWHGLIGYFLIACAFTWSFHFSINLLGIPFVMDLTIPGMALYLIGLAGPLFGGDGRPLRSTPSATTLASTTCCGG